MIKILLLFLVFASISPKTLTTLEFGVETDFNKDINDFAIDSSANETMIVAYIDIQDKQIKLTYTSTANDGESSQLISKEITINSPGGGVMLRSLPNADNELIFSSVGGGEIKGGKIWIYPLDQAFNIDLSAKIDKKYTAYYEAKDSEEFNYKSLIYHIENSGEAKTVYFTSEKNFKDQSVEFKNLASPYEVCWFEDFCEDILVAYTFMDSEQMDLNVRLEKRQVGNKYYYILPAHSFYTINPPKLEYAVDTPFNKDNNVFKIDYTGELTSYLLMYVSTDNKILNTSYSCKSSFTELIDGHNFQSPGGGHIFMTGSGYENLFAVKSPDGNEKGTVWVQPLSKNISIDLSKKQERKFTIKYDYSIEQNLTYVVSNLSKDRKIKFNYQKEFKDNKGQTIKLSNPFKICEGENCQENVESYQFKKGQNYSIGVQFLNETGRYFLPAFSFGNNAGFLGLSLIYLALLLIL